MDGAWFLKMDSWIIASGKESLASDINSDDGIKSTLDHLLPMDSAYYSSYHPIDSSM